MLTTAALGAQAVRASRASSGIQTSRFTRASLARTIRAGEKVVNGNPHAVDDVRAG